ncbi:MAG: cell division protein FtsB [Roseivirga sp.]|jgi:cell division protein FtsB
MQEFWQKIKANFWFKVLLNKYVLSIIIFAIWMSLLDVNSWVIHRELNQEISDLQTSITHYKSEITKDQKQLKELNSAPENLEKFAREQFHLLNPGEEIYLIEYPEKD